MGRCADDVCKLCNRTLGNIAIENHHLVPKRFGGKEMIPLHRICHRKIHTVFSDRELLLHYHTISRLLESEEIIKFIGWVSKKPPEFYDSSKDTAQRRSKRAFSR